MRTWRYSIALSIFVTGCGGPHYADDPDLAAARTAFHCDGPAGPREKRACNGMTRFEEAGPVKSYPADGVTAYLGRLDCSDHTNQIVFQLLGLASGAPPTPNIDDAHRPGGVVRGGRLVTAYSDLRRTAAYVTLEKLIDGEDTPFLTAPQKEDGALPDSWDGWRAKVSETPKPTATSDGKSLLDGPGFEPAFWDDAQKSSAYAFIREVDDELLYVQPADDTGIACVAHVYKLP